MSGRSITVAAPFGFVRRALRRPPRAAYWCALIGTLNVLVWGIIVPPFEVPDENGHYAYVQQLAEAGSLPHGAAVYHGISPRLDDTLAVIDAFEIPGAAMNPAPLTEVEQQRLQAVEHEQLSARGTGNALSAAANPPLYYALETIPYLISPSHSVLNRLALMRGLSAIFAGFTVFFVFMFLRELLPGTRWVWPVGAIAVALQPLFAFISGGLNNDALLYTFSAALFFMVARMFRRGLDERMGLAIGAMVGLGLLAKFTLLGLAPGAALGVALAIWRVRRSPQLRPALRGGAIAAALGVLPTVIYVELANRVVTSGPLGPGGGGARAPGVPAGLRGELDHIWQLFLPTLPGMFPNQFTTVQLWHEWFIGLIGRFGWLDTEFPYWVYLVAGPIAILLVCAAIAALVREGQRSRAHLGELAVYVAMVGGLVVEIGIQSYRTLVTGQGIFEQPRYLLSALCIYAAVVALAARLPGRRWGVVVGAVIISLAFAHDLFSQLQVIARYYA
jgi:4-amino-4-deoxy-L-arabinose transferase-like glycosyltransferase